MRPTYFVTTTCANRTRIFQREEAATLFIATPYDYRRKGNLQVHSFVVMPDHVHLIITPATNVTLEKAAQLIKGGFSFRYGKLINAKRDVWQRSYTEHMIKNGDDYLNHRKYTDMNPVSRELCRSPEAYPFGSVQRAAKAALFLEAIGPNPLLHKHKKTGCSESPRLFSQVRQGADNDALP